MRPSRFTSAAFSPTDISSLYAWYDASDLTTIDKDGSDRVSEWRNKEGTTARDFLQATGGSQPLWVDNDKNLEDVIDFGSSRYMLTAAALSAVTPPVTTFFATQNPATSANTHHILTNHSTGGASYMPWYKESNDSWRYAYTTGGAETFTDATLLGAWSYITTISNGTSSKVRVDGTDKATTPTGTALDMSGFSVGRYNNVGGRYWEEKIGEIIVYDKLLDATEIGQVETYLSDKWSI